MRTDSNTNESWDQAHKTVSVNCAKNPNMHIELDLLTSPVPPARPVHDFPLCSFIVLALYKNQVGKDSSYNSYPVLLKY